MHIFTMHFSKSTNIKLKDVKGKYTCILFYHTSCTVELFVIVLKDYHTMYNVFQRCMSQWRQFMYTYTGIVVFTVVVYENTFTVYKLNKHTLTMYNYTHVCTLNVFHFLCYCNCECMHCPCPYVYTYTHTHMSICWV